MGEVNFLILVFALILGPISIAWFALGFFMLLSEPKDHSKPPKQLDLFGGPNQ